MKLRDIDESLVAEAQPAGLLKRAANKLKKNKPFDKQARQQAEGEEVTQLAANQIAGHFNTWIGMAEATGINPKALTALELMDFFKEEGYADTAEIVIKAAEEKKKPKIIKQDDPEQGDLFDDDGEDAKPKVDTSASVYEARLKAILEADKEADEPITFNPKEVSKLIMQIVATVHRENRAGFYAKVKDVQKAEQPQQAKKPQQASKPQKAEQPQKASKEPEEVSMKQATGGGEQILSDLWDEFTAQLKMDPDQAGVMKAAYVKAAQKVVSDLGEF